MIETNDFRPGTMFEMDGQLLAIVNVEHIKLARAGAVIKAKLRNVRTGSIFEQSFRSGDKYRAVRIEKSPATYLYNDGDHYYFMDTTTFDQIHISAEAMGESKDYLIADAIIRVEFYDNEPVGIELPQTVDLVVKETVPGIKGATASAQVKPATLETGLVVQVPPFINEGDKVRVNTETGEYQARV